MLPHRRRDGYRPGEKLSPLLSAAIEAAGDELEQIDDPVETVVAVGRTWVALDDALGAISSPRLRAISALRAADWSYDRIAEATGLSKGRVAQLARQASNRGL